MEYIMNRTLIYRSLIVLFSLLLLLALFFPLGAYLFSFLSLALVVNSRHFQTKKILLFSLFIILVFTIIINENSVQKFIIREDDFTTYYNNFLDMVYGHYDAFYAFGGGLELGLPIVNYILSVVINAPMPYIVQTVYILLFMLMLYRFSKMDRIFIKEAGDDDRYMLFLWAILFLKITAILTIERQAVATFFILFAISDPRRKIIWLLLGSIFHLSTPIVYFVVNLILHTKNYRRAIVNSLVLLVGVLFSYQILSILVSFFPNDKVGYVLYYLNDQDLVRNEIVKSFKQIAYVIPLVIGDFVLRLRGIKWSLGPSLLFFCLSMMTLSVLPGVPTRLLMPIIYVLFGCYYYNFFKLFTNRTHISAFVLILTLFTIYKIILPGYYFRYPMVDTYPGFYLNSFFDEFNYIERQSLPGIEDVIIKNENKL